MEREIHGPRGPARQVPWTDGRDPRAHGRKGQSNALHLGPRVPSLGMLVCSRTFKNHYIRPHAEQVKLNLPQPSFIKVITEQAYDLYVTVSALLISSVFILPRYSIEENSRKSKEAAY